jgi:hypothetical protein
MGERVRKCCLCRVFLKALELLTLSPSWPGGRPVELVGKGTSPEEKTIEFRPICEGRATLKEREKKRRGNGRRRQKRKAKGEEGGPATWIKDSRGRGSGAQETANHRKGREAKPGIGLERDDP